MPEIQLTAENVCSYTIGGVDDEPFFGVEQTTIDTGMVIILNFLKTLKTPLDNSELQKKF